MGPDTFTLRCPAYGEMTSSSEKSCDAEALGASQQRTARRGARRGARLPRASLLPVDGVGDGERAAPTRRLRLRKVTAHAHAPRMPRYRFFARQEPVGGSGVLGNNSGHRTHCWSQEGSRCKIRGAKPADAARQRWTEKVPRRQRAACGRRGEGSPRSRAPKLKTCQRSASGRGPSQKTEGLRLKLSTARGASAAAWCCRC